MCVLPTRDRPPSKDGALLFGSVFSKKTQTKTCGFLLVSKTEPYPLKMNRLIAKGYPFGLLGRLVPAREQSLEFVEIIMSRAWHPEEAPEEKNKLPLFV